MDAVSIHAPDVRAWMEPHCTLVARSRWGWPLVEEALVAVAKRVSVLLDGRRGHGWVTEARMVLDVGWMALCDVATSGVVTIVEALLIDSTDRGWWRRIVDGLWMGTAGKEERRAEQRQGGEFYQGLLQ